MAGGGKRKTTMAKLTRERRVQERRLEKQARKEARKREAAHHASEPSDPASGDFEEAGGPFAGELDLTPVPHRPADD